MSILSALAGAGLNPLVIGSGAAAASTAMDVWRVGRQSDEAEFSRDWSAQQYAKRYQTTMADMRAAGLNPLLAAGGGQVSGQPTGDTADVPEIGNPVTTAFEVARRRKELDLIDKQIEKTDAEAKLTAKTMPPADPWRMFYDFLQSTGLFSSAKASAGGAIDYMKNVVKTYPLLPSGPVVRRPAPPITQEQREQVKRKGFYYRYPKLEGR